MDRKSLLVTGMSILLGSLSPAYETYAHEAMPTQAQPKGWLYDGDCCNNEDCQVVPRDSIFISPTGLVVHLDPGDHKNVSYPVSFDATARLKRSKDEDYHVCIRKAFKPTSELSIYGDRFVILANGMVQMWLCVYIPKEPF